MAQKTTNTDTYVLQKEAAEIIGCSLMSIYRWEKQGIFPSRHKPEGVFGPYVYYKRTDVEAFKKHEYHG